MRVPSNEAVSTDRFLTQHNPDSYKGDQEVSEGNLHCQETLPIPPSSPGTPCSCFDRGAAQNHYRQKFPSNHGIQDYITALMAAEPVT